jgi:hypothetical protein
VTEDSVLRRTFGPKEVRAEGQGKVHYESFIICTLHLIVKVMESTKMPWVGRVTRMGEMINAYKMLVENF